MIKALASKFKTFYTAYRKQKANVANLSFKEKYNSDKHWRM